jgi:hypothetical protein
MKVQEMQREEVPECWLKPEQLDVLEALCKTYDTNLKEIMLEQTLDWARRRTEEI